MTAFASIILAALPAVGAKSGGDGALSADGQAMAGQGARGAFDALMATLTGAAMAQPDAQSAAATSMPVPAAAVAGADISMAVAGASDGMPSGLSAEEAEASPAVVDGASPESSVAAEALAAAGAVVLAPTPTTSTPPATPDAEPMVAPAVAAAPTPAVADAAGDPAHPVMASAASSRDAVASSGPSTPAADGAPRGGSANAATSPVVTAPTVAAVEATSDATPATDPALGAVAEGRVAPPPALPSPPRPQSATEAVSSLIGRVLDGARKPGSEAAVRQAAADAAPPVEAAADAVVDTPVELAVDTALSPEAPVPVETAVVQTPVAPAPAPERRAARAEAARVDVAGDASASAGPDLKPAARPDARPTAAAAPAPLTSPDLPLAPAPLAELGAEADQATLDTTPAAPMMQAAAETPAEAVPTRGSPETVARLAADIARKLEGRTTRFDVQLDPLGLGKVDVSIEINADGRLSASLSFDSAQTAADLRGRAGELRQALENAGFDLADGGLSFDMNNPGGSSGREARETLDAWSSRAFQAARSGLEQADALAVRFNSSRTPSGGVDIRI